MNKILTKQELLDIKIRFLSYCYSSSNQQKILTYMKEKHCNPSPPSVKKEIMDNIKTDSTPFTNMLNVLKWKEEEEEEEIINISKNNVDKKLLDIGPCVHWRGERKIKKGKTKESCSLIFNYKNKEYNARKLSISLFQGIDIQKNIKIYSTCDDLYCVRPSHLFDNSSNNEIMKKRKRSDYNDSDDGDDKNRNKTQQQYRQNKIHQKKKARVI